jgi:hypothetical protein
LGVLYVVDSVTRKWLEQAKAQAQAINSSAPDGTYAAGVNRVTELMPVLMNDILQTAPEEQKVRIFDYHPHVAGTQRVSCTAHRGASCKTPLSVFLLSSLDMLELRTVILDRNSHIVHRVGKD